MTTHEALHADLRAETAYVADPPQECLNGCEAQQGDARSKVFCEPRHLLCPKCADRLTKWLRALPESFGLLLWVVDHGTVPADPGTKHTKQPDPPAPMRLEVTDLLDIRHERGALGILHGWAQVVREERNQPARCNCGHMGLGHPTGGHCTAKKCPCSAYEPIKPTVKAECHLLAANLPWIVEQPFAGDLYGEVKELRRHITDVLGEHRARPVGKCAVLGDIRIGDGADDATVKAPCGGALVMDREGRGVKCLRCDNRQQATAGLRELGLIVGALIKDDGTQLEAAS